MSSKEIKYTDSAKERLAKLHNSVDVEIESFFRQEKYIPGDDFIEITAMDIEDISKRVKLIKPTGSSLFRQYILLSYSIMGICLTLFGLYYDEILDIIINGRGGVRLIYIVGGLFFTITSLFMYFYLKMKEKAQAEIRQKSERQE